MNHFKKDKKNNNLNKEVMNYLEILEIISTSALEKKTVEIYYPETNNSPEGWREIEPYNISNDIGDEKEILIYNKDRLSPGHILNAYTIGNKENYCNSFIIGKIKKARKTSRSFVPRNNWKINF
jgi:hypothetical protein